MSSLTLQQTRLQRQLERKVKEFEKLREEREVIETAQINIAPLIPRSQAFDNRN